MGSHTDYNLGYVMTMTIDRDTWIAARPRDDRVGPSRRLENVAVGQACPAANIRRSRPLTCHATGGMSKVVEVFEGLLLNECQRFIVGDDGENRVGIHNGKELFDKLSQYLPLFSLDQVGQVKPVPFESLKVLGDGNSKFLVAIGKRKVT